MNGSKLPLRLTVEYISFSAHVDFKENSEFIQDVASKNLVLVHGDSNEMGRLRGALTSRYAERDIPLEIYTPRNTETVSLHFRGEKIAKIVGTLGMADPQPGVLIQGILASKDFTFSIVAPSQLDEFTDLCTAKIVQKQSLKTHAPLGIIKWHLEQMFGPMETTKTALKIFKTVTLIPHDSSIQLEWESNPLNDMIADSIITVILQAEISPASVKGNYILTIATKSEHTHSHGEEHTHESPVKPIKELPNLPSVLHQALLLAFGEESLKRDDDIWQVILDDEELKLALVDSKWVRKAHLGNIIRKRAAHKASRNDMPANCQDCVRYAGKLGIIKSFCTPCSVTPIVPIWRQFNMVVVITGASGLLGKAVYDQMKSFDTVIATGYTRAVDPLVKLNLLDQAATEDFLKLYNPNVVIHCAAERRPDVSAQNEAQTLALNVDACRKLAKLSNSMGFFLIYISSDYVFDGTNPPYDVDATPNPLNFYGKSKLAGEQAIIGELQNYCILRIPVLYGKVSINAESAVNVLIDVVNDKSKQHIVDDYAPRYPTCTIDVAIVLREIVGMSN